MKLQSQFIKLPGERVNIEHLEQGLENPETYAANFWIARDNIAGVMELKDEQTGELSNSLIYTYSDEKYWCAIPANAVMALIDQYDRKAMEQSLIYPTN